jgi:hypothetical protein
MGMGYLGPHLTEIIATAVTDIAFIIMLIAVPTAIFTENKKAITAAATAAIFFTTFWIIECQIK